MPAKSGSLAVDGKQLGVISLGRRLEPGARQRGGPGRNCRRTPRRPFAALVDFGKYRYEQAKKDKESKKHQHANKVKEIQLSPKIDPA